MAKTTMTHERRKGILEWMYAQYDAKQLPALQKAADKAFLAANKAVRSKYPEGDMVVLRKYNSTRTDACLKFMNTDTQQVFGVDFNLRNHLNGYTDVSIQELDLSPLADVPSRRGCNSNDVFPISPTGQKAVEEFVRTVEKFRDARRAKFVDYGAFTLGCKTVDEFNDAIPMPEEMQKRYLSGGALIHLSEQKIAELKKEFAPKKAA